MNRIAKPGPWAARTRGFTLIECLLYIGVYTVILGAAMLAFYRCFDMSRGLRRNADDITRALHAGELWRDDVRAAVGAIQLDEAGGVFRIPQADRQVSFKFEDGEILRQTGADAPWLVLLANVGNSQMAADARGTVKAWRWELELKTFRKATRLKPLFSFLAVPENGGKP